MIVDLLQNMKYIVWNPHSLNFIQPAVTFDIFPDSNIITISIDEFFKEATDQEITNAQQPGPV